MSTKEKNTDSTATDSNIPNAEKLREEINEGLKNAAPFVREIIDSLKGILNTPTATAHDISTVHAAIKLLSSIGLTADQQSSAVKYLKEMTEPQLDMLRANLSLLGFYKKGGAWNGGLIAEVGDLLRPNTGAHETVKSAINIGLKSTGVATGAYLAYRSGKAVLERMGVMSGASMMMAAAATMGAATFGE